MKLPRPFHNKLIVKEDLSKSLSPKLLGGVVVDVGCGTRCETITGGWLPVDAAIGQKIIFYDYESETFESEDGKYHIIPESAILAKYPYSSAGMESFSVPE